MALNAWSERTTYTSTNIKGNKRNCLQAQSVITVDRTTYVSCWGGYWFIPSLQWNHHQSCFSTIQILVCENLFFPGRQHNKFPLFDLSNFLLSYICSCRGIVSETYCVNPSLFSSFSLRKLLAVIIANKTSSPGYHGLRGLYWSIFFCPILEHCTRYNKKHVSPWFSFSRRKWKCPSSIRSPITWRVQIESALAEFEVRNSTIHECTACTDIF